MIINKPEQIQHIQLHGLVGFDIETSGLDPKKSQILLVSFTDNNNTYVIDFTVLDIQLLKRIDVSECTLIGHNIVFDIKHVYYHTGILYTNVIDTMINEQLLSAGKFVPDEKRKPFSLEAVTRRRLGIQLNKDIRQEFIEYNGTLSDQAYEYAGEDTQVLLPIFEQQLQEIKNHELDQVWRLECDLLPVTAKLELAGVQIDLELLASLEKPFERYIEKCEQALQDLFIAHGAANRIIWQNTYKCVKASSKDQIKEALNAVGVAVDSLEAKKLAKWDLRKNKVNLDILLAMFDDQDIADAIENFGGYNNPFLRAYAFYVGAEKLYNSYIIGIRDKVHTDNCYYPWFQQLGARSTGRYSSNAQQIPKDDKLERLGIHQSIRKCIQARKGKSFVIADFSAIELVIIAERSGDEKLAYEHLQGDLHTLVTNEIMGMFWPIAKETTKAKAKTGIHKLLRDFSKTLSYGIAYGVTGKSLSDQADTKLAGTGLTFSQEDGDRAIAAWKKLFPDAGKYLDESAKQAITLGYTESLWGRKRWYDLDHIRGNKWLTLAAMREGSNQGIQSTGSDMTKQAMIYFDRVIHANRAKLVLTVHDELVAECDDDYVEYCQHAMKISMERAARDILPRLGHTVIVDVAVSKRYDK